jgi:hypothetical protein
MQTRSAWLALAMVGMGAAPAWAQPAVAVQLPTYSFFGINTTVSVPDRGSVYLGGVNRAQSGLNEARWPLLPFAPFRNRGLSTGASAAGASASVYIHDFEAMDPYWHGLPSSGPALASGDGPGVAGAKRSVPQRSALLGLHSVQPQPPATASRPLVLSPAELARQQPLAPVDPQQEAENLFALGTEAQSQGNLGAAKVFYEMAARRATGELRTQILARLEVVSPSRQVPRVARPPR